MYYSLLIIHSQDVAAARVVMQSGVPFVQPPCNGVVDKFTVSKPELELCLKEKNPLAHYLAQNAIAEAEGYAKGKAWTRVIWDVTAVAWPINDSQQFMESRIIPTPIPTYDNFYATNADLKASEIIEKRHIFTAKYFRSLDRKYFGNKKSVVILSRSE